MQNEIIKTDQELVSAALSDTHAFSEIIHRYEASIRRYTRHIGCTDDDDVEDILQEIFIKVFIHLNDYDKDLKFSSWLYRIAHNEIISFLRKKNVRPRVLTLSTEDAEEFFAQLADDKDFVELAHQRDDARIIRDILPCLGKNIGKFLYSVFLRRKAILRLVIF